MIRIRSAIILGFLALWVGIVAAQTDCGIEANRVLETVENVCNNVGENQVCYGNFEVNAIPRLPSLDLSFSRPGDSTNLANVRSLYLSSLSPENSTWGIAQMRLLLSSPQGQQDVTMLLFGDVELDNASQEQIVMPLTVRSVGANLFDAPSGASLVLDTVQNGATLNGVGRLEDGAWIRVENPLRSIVGWVLSTQLTPLNAGDTLSSLPVQDPETPYYGPMQALYFQNGTSTGCSNIASDGMLIQTPEGVARVSLLINEVSIELTGAETGGATAFVQANPEETETMSINVLGGSATVQTGNSSQTVSAGQQTIIPISLNLSPQGAPSNPQPIDPSQANVGAYLPILNTVASSGGSGTTNVTINNNSTTGSANNTGNTTTDNSGNNTTQSNTGNGGSVSTTGNSQTPTQSSSNPLDQVGSSGSGTTTDAPTVELTGGNLIALVLFIVVAVAFLGWLIYYTVTNSQREEE